jgi:hypothetical protein
MRLSHRASALALALCAALAGADGARSALAQTLSAPEAVGDQVAFYFDARPSYTTFFSVRSTATTPLTLRMLFYTGDFSSPFVQTIELEPANVRIIDVGGLRQSGLPALPGIAFATAVDGSSRSIVTRALAGNLTVANLATGSGWGTAGAARLAQVQGSDEPPALGTPIDGTSVFLPPISPTAADLAAYYDPNQLAPAAEGGNQLIFVSFRDVPGTTYAAEPVSSTWRVRARRNDGTVVASHNFSASGVVVSDLVSVAGAGVAGASGWIRFNAQDAGTPTRLIYFTEALGTFGTGYLLPDTLIPCCIGS